MAQGGVFFRYHSSTGRSDLRGVFRKVDSDLDLGDYWDEVNLVFATSPTTADTEITLTETGSTGFYSAKSSKLGTYTGRGLKLIRDTTSGLDPESQYEDVWIANGVESTIAPASSLTTSETISAANTWTITSDGGTASETVSATSSDITTVAMDFSALISGGDSITRVDTVQAIPDASADQLTIENRRIHTDGDKAVLTLSNFKSGVSYDITITITTVDGDSFSGTGGLTVS